MKQDRNGRQDLVPISQLRCRRGLGGARKRIGLTTCNITQKRGTKQSSKIRLTGALWLYCIDRLLLPARRPRQCLTQFLQPGWPLDPAPFAEAGAGQRSPFAVAGAPQNTLDT